MYKVFVDNISICFQKDLNFSCNLPKQYLPILSKDKFESFKTDIKEISKTQTITVFSPDPLHAMKNFFKEFKWIEAAGGIVKNDKTKKELFILRNGFWDIPKGKIEEGESPESGAIREIQEECGINELKINRELSPTYHVYFAYEKHFIKKTYWYKMTSHETDVTPQAEEGITEVRWFDQNELEIVQSNTFTSILEVIEENKQG
ncbi:NUDIX hydrolase [Brumimicrobium aurantiacum]|uniref:NUDIX domain-containing protein n=1 Tax=Brumimicrobium aurantiacum TaxID=1737063 RepID=A0A3E1EZY0_9FLAO|nr:NUDIX domain-containing protein [Brumimicrobium aurantiacum]RFC55129.1 NUDIX domain-containing protein [Brumimicrobium aurantiacum]